MKSGAYEQKKYVLCLKEVLSQNLRRPNQNWHS